MPQTVLTRLFTAIYLLAHPLSASTENRTQNNRTQNIPVNYKLPYMFKNYFKISWRNLSKNKAYTFINVSGLALSMACGILIFTLIQYHLSFDDFHKDSSRIYRFVTEAHRDVVNYNASVPPPLAKAFRTDYTFGEETANIVNLNGEFVTVKAGNDIKTFKEEAGFSFTEAGYFNIFNFPLLSGDKKTMLAQPNTAVITQRVAEKYFGRENPVNKMFNLEGRVPVKVTGVLANLPANTDQKAEIFISYATLKPYGNGWFMKDDSWGGISTELQCFVKLRPGVSAAEVEKALPAFVTKFRPKNRNVHHYKLQPLADVHFNARYGGVMEKRNLWILSFIALFIIVTACVNFINLATAQALKRSKEVGVRKVLGGMRSQLFWQFIGETALITAIGLAAAIGLSLLLLPYVNTLFSTQMDINIFTNVRLLLFLIGLVLVVTFFAGSYPGLILARFQPVAALKGKISGQNIGGFNTRRALIVTQFAISQILIIGMIVIGVQMHYSKDSDLGFDKDAVVMVPIGTDSTGGLLKPMKAQLQQIAGVQKVSVCGAAPSSESNWNTSARYDNRQEDEIFSLSIKAGDDQYVPTFGLELAAGRNLYPADSVREMLVNETFVRKLNLTSPQQVLGKTLAFNGSSAKGQIVGVVKDFHDRSFHSEINAVCICQYADNYGNFAVKINMNNAKAIMPAIEKAWNKIYPNQVYSYHFLDDQIAEFYETEQTMLTLIQVFSFIAIFIGCLGLYGLVLFMAAQKTKEIGIRKVLGGTVRQILWIFGKEFGRLILIAFLIAAPVAWLLMSNWLQGFKYHIPFSPLFFVITIVLMFVIASLTIGYQAARAALMNPVKSLKTE